MGNEGLKRYREPGSACTMCEFWDGPVVRPAVDAAGTSPLEVDGLCVLHRARATEGACILCGRGWPWVLMRPGSQVGVCRPCYVEQEGRKGAEDLEQYWKALSQCAGFWPASPAILPSWSGKGAIGGQEGVS